MARGERDALDALGLDSARAGFALDADRLREHVEAVRGPVTALADALRHVTARIDEVQAHALAAVETANRTAAEAEAARVGAQQARERAEAQARVAGEAAAQAEADRADAVGRAGAAARRAMEATEALGAARQQVQDAAAARDAALAGTAEAQRAAAQAHHDGREAALRAERADAGRVAAEQRAGEWRAEVQELRAGIDTARRDAATAAADRDGAVDRARRLAEDLVGERSAREEAVAALRSARERAEAEAELRARAEAELDRARSELERTRRDLDTARAPRPLAPEDLRSLLAALTPAAPLAPG